ncbi:MAG: rRNA maturation RNase YbeY [Leptospirales bacterium]|nr:rRNA maturation RNase YbeY [Leptospirales bacterium]
MRNIGIFTEGEISLPYNGIGKKFFTAAAEKVFNIIDIDNISINIILTDNKFIRSINKDYREKNRPTDVISFAYRDAASPDESFPAITEAIEELGDIYISLEKASEQSSAYGVSLKDELKRLLIHGILHLLGYDHEISKEEDKRMSSLEDEIFNKI